MRATTHVLSQRLADVADVHLRDMLAGDPHLRQLSVGFAQALLANREEMLVELAMAGAHERLARALAAGMAAYMTREHQFVELAGADRLALEDRYAVLVGAAICALASGDPELALGLELERHHDWLQAWVAGLLEDADALDAARAGLNVVCAEYSPLTQLRILGLAGVELMDPILDVGCGRTGALVHHLRRAGHTAVGVDQDTEEAPGLQRGNWFDLPLEPATWGAIIAHQSFTLHFLHAHMASGERATAFARSFMSILAALKPGGCFAYAPGVPFFERHLDRARFSLASRAISLPGRAMPPAMSRALDGEPLSATIITLRK